MHSEAELCSRWTSLSDEDVTIDLVKEILLPIKDDLWVAAASVDRILDNLAVQRFLLELGLERTKHAAERIDEVLKYDDSSSSENENRLGRLSTYFSEQVTETKLYQLRVLVLCRLDRLHTYEEIVASSPTTKKVVTEDGWEDDPWGDTEGEGQPENAPFNSRLSLPPLSLFISESPSHVALLLASQMQFGPLHILRDRHWMDIFPHRFEILDQIPLFADSISYRDLLPMVDPQSGMELPVTETPWRTDKDVVEDEDVQTILTQSRHPIFPSDEEESEGQSADLFPNLLGSDQITSWIQARAESIYSSTGMVDISLGLVQHAVSRGILGLDALGEDLSLLSRLVYDRPNPEFGDQSDQLTLSEWHSLEPQEVVRHYLARSTPSTIVTDIRRLVMPYLFVLESRAERACHPDPDLITRLLYAYILDADLQLVAAIFDASKPTMMTSQRIITNDEDMARLALACLYGSNELNCWTTMSRIFECLPAWSNTTEEDEGDETDTTVASLSSFLTPSTTRPQASPSDLLIFFKPLPAQSLSRALDVLDVHLESGEILARWGVPVPLRWFLQSAHDEAQQRARAMRMARQADAPQGDLDSEDVWLSLLEDMLKVARSDDSSAYCAFGALSADEIRQIFFRGILSTGKFNIAKHIILPRHGERLLEPEMVESICLECSREYYDNADSGNYNFGNMKTAYDCLAVCPQTPAVRKEREFIEATSRIASFNVSLRRGVPILPIEIRLTKDKLTLIAAVLSSNESAYKHAEVILELVRKLGFRDDALAEVKTLAMVAETALQAEDFPRAFEANERMIAAVAKLRATAPLNGGVDARVQEAMEVCWVACYQLGRQPECDDVPRKLTLLGRALELCPADKLVDILPAWRKLDAEYTERLREKATSQTNGDKKHADRTRGRSTLSSKLHDLHMPSPALPSASILASQTLSKVAASLPFSVHGRPSSGSRERTRSPDVQSQARHALQRGIGWLIGADEDELQ